MVRWVALAIIELFKPKALLVAEHLRLRQQLLVLQRRHPRPWLAVADRQFWIIACVRAPVSGIAILPPTTGSKAEQVTVEIGSKVTKGAAMFSIANLEALAVRGEIDEIDIGKVAVGQRVSVTGAAFTDHSMQGEVVAVSSQATSGKSGRGGLPKFPVSARIDGLTPAQRRNVKIGMSAYLEIRTYEKPDALIVPATAVHSGGENSWVQRRDPETGAVQRVEVTTGPTTIGGVEILSGLAPGDVIVLGAPEDPAS